MTTQSDVGFGDRVRIVRTQETEERGFADAVGMVLGFTTPSATGITDVIGGLDADLAFNVDFDSPEPGNAWFAPDLVSFVDHGPGLDVQIGEKRLRRTAEGEWEPSDPASN